MLRQSSVQEPTDNRDEPLNTLSVRKRSVMTSDTKMITLAFVLRTKVHGLKYIFTTDKSKVQCTLWFLALSACIGLLFTWSWNRVFYLLSYPVATKIYMAWAHNVTFPAVTLCNQNLFRVSRLTKADLYHSGYWMDILHQNRSMNRKSAAMLKHSRHRERLIRKLDFSDYSPPPHYQLNTTEMISRVGHQLKDMLLECKFSGKICTSKNFSTIYTRYGKCYTFNSGVDGTPLLTMLKGGTGNGLEIMLDIQQDEYLPVWGDTDETSYEAGIKVQIHSQDEPPFIDQLGFGVAPGFQTFVSCQQQRIQYLPPPWGDCRSTPLVSDYFPTYSITACRIECETQYLLDICNCRMVHMPGTSTVCTPEQYKECADPALDYLVEKDSKVCVCQTPCNMTRYGKELSMVKIPSKGSVKYLAKKFNKTEQYIGENILVLDIFFEALNYEKIEQKKAYEVAGLLGDIGGQMGLFIGASVLTILEIFDYLYEVFKDKVLNYTRKDRSRRSTSDNLEYSENQTSTGVTSNHVPRYADKPSNIEHVSTCDTLRSHSDSLGFTPNMLPSHPTLGNFEEFAC
ncbi:acid-sensing ion channel 1C isoform X2 [Brachyhypopomus gauderio]|uniref:acid-sensing ion channel 1C isoform X2 n=1 Tax=Brachyhypopomus gauderio TaxID=698409 RepID=UPI004041FEE0